MHRCLISFGANIGDARATVLAAAELLRQQLAEHDRFTISRLFSTPPVGGPTGQSSFINAVAAIETSHDVSYIWNSIRQIEKQLGRQRQQRWEARRIDLDILLFDDYRIWTPHLKIPHPRMCMRRFILIPAAQVAPNWIDPVSGFSIAQLANRLIDSKGSFILIGPSAARSQELLESASLPETQLISVEQMLMPSLGDCEQVKETRYVAGCSFDQFNRLAQPIHSLEETMAKLLVFWQEEQESPISSQDNSTTLSSLNLIEHTNLAPNNHSSIILKGPRYLMMIRDPQWAIHELTAALEAMDCVIRIEESKV